LGAIFGIIGNYKESEIERMISLLSHRGIGSPEVSKYDTGFIGCFDHPERNNHIVTASQTLCIDGYFGDNSVTDSMMSNLELISSDNLSGLYSCAHFNSSTGQLTLFRDPSGSRPLYFVKTSDRFAFASAPHALLALHDVSRELNPDGVVLYMTMICPPDPVTIYKNISMLPPGQKLVCVKNNISRSPFWSPPWKSPADSISPETAAPQIHDALKLSVLDAMPENLDNTGFFLSGGTDTGAVVAFAAQANRGRIKTFTIGYKGEGKGYEDYNEFQYAKLIADRFKTDHHECYISPDSVKSSLPGIIASLHQPSGDAINTYLVAATLPPNIDTVLTGTGGDEIFIGSHWFKQQTRLLNSSAKWQRIPSFLRSIILTSSSILPGNLSHRIARLNALLNGVPAQYEHFKFLFSGKDRISLFTPEFYAQINDSVSPENIVASYDVPDADLDVINRMENLFFKHEVSNLQLRDVDSMSHAHGIEARSPLVDRRLLDLLCQVSGHDKAPDGHLRHLMFMAMGDLLLEKTKTRRKMSFIVPMDLWARRDLKSIIDTLLAPESINKRGVFNPDAVQKEKQAFFHSGLERHPFKIWNLALFELWCRFHIDAPLGATVPDNIEDLL